jgi:NADPH:quinone reductase-like Zn-dependent oxidoreductase
VNIRTQVFPLAEAAEAHRRAENCSVDGRILLAP